MSKELYQAALEYHAIPRPGKVALALTKPANTQEDLSLAYSPGVAAPCLAIHKDPEAAYRYTAKGNTVAVISNGSAVLGFPYIFRGALDVRAHRINEEMKLAAAMALAALAKEPVPEAVMAACGGQHLAFGPEYIVPKPMDPRLLGVVSAAVAKAAVDTGVALHPYPKHYPLTSLDDIVY